MSSSLVRTLAAAVALAVPAASAHAASWLEPVGMDSEAASGVAVATGNAGDTAAVWQRADVLEARLRSPGAAFGDKQLLAADPQGFDVAMSGDGTAVAVWREGDAVRYAVRAPGGPFAPAQTLPAETQAGAGAPTDVQVVMNDRGDALIAYARGRAFASLRAAGGNFEAPAPVSAGEPCALRSALGAGGHAALAWHQTCSGGAAHAARRAPGAGFGPTEVLTQAGELTEATAVTVESDGTTVVAWKRSTGAIRATTAASGAPFGEPVTLGAPEEANSAPTLASGGGEVWAAWLAAAPGGRRVVAARRPPGAGFAPGATISPEGVSDVGPRLRAAADGSLAAAWLREIEGEARVEAARRPAGAGTFEPSATVSKAGAAAGSLTLGSDGDGNFVAGYLRGGLPVAHVLDAAGPRLLGVEMRSTGFALEPYPFSANHADAWSAVASSAFDFGDGTPPAPGPAASHAFPEPAAARTVTISAADSVGNTSRATRPFDVLPALDRTPPVISQARMDAKRFKISSKETAISAATRRRGTRFRYTLSEPAQVVFYFERLLPGRLAGKNCRRQKKGMRGRRCTFVKPSGLITRAHPVAGPVSVGFTGRLVGRSGLLRVVDVTLSSGRYRATLTAFDALKNHSESVRLNFTIVR